MTRPRLTRKKKSVSAAQRTIAFLKKYGYAVGIAEKWNPHVGIRQDLFGFIDLVAIKAGCPIRAINCTTASEIGRHLEKYNANPHIRTWLSSSGKPSFELWAWRRLKAPKNAGRKRVLWSPRIFVFELCDDGNVTPVERFYSNPRNRVGGGLPT